MLNTNSKIVNRCSLPALPKLMGVGRFLNRSSKNIERGLTIFDFRNFSDERPVATAQKNLSVSK